MRHWTSANGLPQNWITSLAQTPDGALWVGTGTALVRFDGLDFEIFDRTNSPGLPSVEIKDLSIDPEGHLRIATRQGVVRRTADGFESLPHPTPKRPRHLQGFSSRLPTGEVPLLLDRHQVLWTSGTRTVGHQPSGAAAFERYALDGLSDVLRPLPPIPVPSRPSVLVETRDGELWAGLMDGLYRWDGQGFVHEWRGARVEAMLEDREGNLWVGTQSQGLLQLRRQRKFKVLTMQQGLPHDVVWTALETDDGLWIGTHRGLALWSGGRVETVPIDPRFDNERVYSLAAGSEGTLWVGTSAGLAQFDPRTGRLLVAQEPRTPVRGQILDRPNGELWLSSNRHVVRRVANPSEPSVTLSQWTMLGDGDTRIRGLHVDTRGDLWIASLLTGLHVGRAGSVTAIDHPRAPTAPQSFLGEADGTLWITTRDQGVVRYRDGDFVPVTPGHGLVDGTVHHLLDDGLGWFWLTSDRGISRVRRDDLHAVADGRLESLEAIDYGIDDGLLSTECNSGFPGPVRLRDGRLAFPTMRGLALVDPARLPHNDVPPSVEISRLLVDYDPTPASGPVTLEPHQRNLAVEYRALTFVAPRASRFRYRLEGYDPGWVEAGERRAAFYTGLPPGQYTFRVQAANADGVWSTEDATLALDLPPRFHETPLFYGLAFGLVLCLGWAGARWRSSHLHELELEALVDERTQRLLEERHLRIQLARRIELEGTVEDLEPASEAFLRRVQETVESHLSTPGFGVHELAEELGLSPRHLRRKLLQLTDESPSALIRRLRLERARQLLEKGVGNVSEVAYRVGISKPAYFSELFRKAHGAPPSAFLPGA